VATTTLPLNGKDFRPEMKAEQRDSLRCASWFTLNWKKVDTSQAQFWVFVLHGFKTVFS